MSHTPDSTKAAFAALMMHMMVGDGSTTCDGSRVVDTFICKRKFLDPPTQFIITIGFFTTAMEKFAKPYG